MDRGRFAEKNKRPTSNVRLATGKHLSATGGSSVEWKNMKGY
jgi:hypothetical protein